jgi:hypothetical protein
VIDFSHILPSRNLANLQKACQSRCPSRKVVAMPEARALVVIRFIDRSRRQLEALQGFSTNTIGRPLLLLRQTSGLVSAFIHPTHGSDNKHSHPTTVTTLADPVMSPIYMQNAISYSDPPKSPRLQSSLSLVSRHSWILAYNARTTCATSVH